MRARDNWVLPCAKCKYAKSCFMETGVAECPSGYHKMYTGYLFGGHQGHHGNNDRVCVDKNPANSDCEGDLPSLNRRDAVAVQSLSLPDSTGQLRHGVWVNQRVAVNH